MGYIKRKFDVSNNDKNQSKLIPRQIFDHL